MSVIKSFFISFSIYSKIPMPQFIWKDEDMRYTLVFFPWIGAVIGSFLMGWSWICGKCEVGTMGYTLIGTAIPLIITGGFHVDGFMDTMDAFSSYQPRERKIEILKDSHIGAFAGIMLVLYYMLYMGAFSEIKNQKDLMIFAMGFFMSRVLSGIGVVSIPSAKKDGMLCTFASTAHEKIVKVCLYFQFLLCTFAMLWVNLKPGVCAILTALICYFYYRYKSLKELGGITGDTAGYFVTICECAIAFAIAIGGRI